MQDFLASNSDWNQKRVIDASMSKEYIELLLEVVEKEPQDLGYEYRPTSQFGNERKTTENVNG